MAPSVSEARDTIEELKPPDETAPTTEETKSASPAASASESSKQQKKKKKKQRDSSSATAETQKAEDDKNDEKENGKANKNSTKDSTNSQNDGTAEKESNSVVAPSNDVSSGPVVSSTKRTRPPYKYDPDKVTLRFLFANRDGLTVTVECKPSDTVGQVKGQLLSVWPEDLQNCSSGDQLRLICMGKGMLAPDTRTLQNCEVPVFRTHPTPVNVAVRPIPNTADSYKSGKGGNSSGGGPSGGSNHRISDQSGQGCGCVIS